MNSSERLFFIALLPTVDIQNKVTEIKQYFVENYNSRHALKSPPHVSLQPPFKWSTEKVEILEECLTEFCQSFFAIPIILSGFGAFPPRVIYVNVIKTPELLAIQKALMYHLESSLNIVDKVSKRRPFAPHMTVAFRDLTRKNFKAAWREFEHKSLEFKFTVPQLTLLVHNGQKWNIKAEFPFPSAGN